MKSFISRFTLTLLLILSVAILCTIFYPRNYSVPKFENRANTKYWQLSTGSKIAYTKLNAIGIRKEYPIIFLQGGPGAPIFDSNIAVLSKLTHLGYDVYLYDLVGCGGSNRLDDINEYSVDRHLKDLDEIIKNITSKKVILIAQSWGAILATNYAAEHQECIDKIIFTSAAPVFPIKPELKYIESPDSLYLKLPKTSNTEAKKKIYHLKERIIEFVAEMFSLKLVADKEMDQFATLLNFEMSKSTVVDSSLSKIKSGYGYYVNIKTAQSFKNVPDHRKELQECKFPVLIMRSQYDFIPWGYTEEYLKLFSNNKFVFIKNAGHSIALEQDELYINFIEDFLK